MAKKAAAAVCCPAEPTRPERFHELWSLWEFLYSSILPVLRFPSIPGPRKEAVGTLVPGGSHLPWIGNYPMLTPKPRLLFFSLSTRLYKRLLVTICDWRNYPMLTPPAKAKTTFFSKILKYMASWLSYLFLWPQYAYVSILRPSSWWIEKNQKPTQQKSAQKCFSWLRI